MAVISVDNIADMISTGVVGDCIIVAGYYEPGDGGGGTFVCRGLPSPWGSQEDGGLILLESGRFYQRIVNTPYVSARWFGAYGDGVTVNDDAMDHAMGPVENYVTTSGVHNYTGYCYQDISIYSLNQRATRTRIFFPAGIYKMTTPISKDWRRGMQLVGDNAIWKASSTFPGSSTPVGTHVPPALTLGHSGATRLAGVTWKGFQSGVDIQTLNADGAGLIVEHCGFSDIAFVNDAYLYTYAIQLEHPSSYVEFRNCHWRNCRHAIWQDQGQTYVKGGKIEDAPWLDNIDGQIVVKGTEWLVMEDTICSPANVSTSEYADKCAWIKAYGNFHGINLKFLPAASGMVNVGAIIIPVNVPDTLTWLSGGGTTNYVPSVRLRDSQCSAAGPVVKLYKIPSVNLIDNYGFISDQPVIKFSGPPLPSPQLKSILTKMQVILSFKLDNIPNAPTRQPNSLFQPSNHRDQLRLLPYVRVNTGLTSYGFLEDLSETPEPQELQFYLGRTSFNHFSSYPDWCHQQSATENTISCIVKLMNVVDIDNPSTVKYSEFRIEMYIHFFQPIIGTHTGRRFLVKSIENITNNTDSYAPYLELVDPGSNANNTNQIFLRAYNDPETPSLKRPYGIFYEISYIIPPVIRMYYP